MGVSSIDINLIGDDIPDGKDYRKTSPNTRSEQSNVLLSFASQKPGCFNAEGRGQGLQADDVVFVSLKGSKTLTLPLTIKRVIYLIEPPDHWQAELIGEEFGSLNIHTWQVKCDSCQQQYPLEFVSRHLDDAGAQVFHAESRLSALKWLLQGDKHICPECVAKGRSSAH